MSIILESFNPCSIGFSFRRRYLHGWDDEDEEFQSLFYWIFLSEPLKMAADAAQERGFNPCSIGFSFRSAGGYVREGGIEKVSILVLLDFPFGAYRQEVANGLHNMFQSLFYWIFLSEIAEHAAVGAVDHVSILVLLDFPFGVTKKTRQK